MQTIGVLLLAAATAGDGFGYSDTRRRPEEMAAPHAEVTATATGPPPYTAATMAGGRRRARKRPPVHSHQEPDLLP